MVIIELLFTAGRFHANPWGRNVNEGVAEWPPSPYRLVRALVDVWKRRFPSWPEERILPILGLFSTPIRFALPRATTSHTRSYLHTNTKDSSKLQLVFDAFVAVNKSDPLYIGLEGELPGEALRDLEALVEQMNYLGRSESWVRMGLTDTMPHWNCLPLDGGKARYNNPQAVACVHPPESESPDEAWLKALLMSTDDLHDQGWSSPPAIAWITYDVPRFVEPLSKSTDRQPLFRFARFALSGTVLPGVTNTMPFAERVRRRLMGIHRRIQNGDPELVSRVFSGKNEAGFPLESHRHAFFLPLDEDNDGFLDHLVVSSVAPFDRTELKALDWLRSLPQGGGKPDVDLVLVALSADSPLNPGTRWQSATPFVTSRHYRKGRGTYEEWLNGEVARECQYHGLPTPASVEWIGSHVLENGRRLLWLDFVRSRKGDRPLSGHGCRLTFDHPVPGPLALGSLCHYGMGLFIPSP